MKQQTLAGLERYRKTTRRAQFLADMEGVVAWPELQAVVEPVYPKVSEAGGRPPIPLERMLRIYFLQLWSNLSDPAVEDALYDSAAIRSFAGIDLGREPAPDETTVCKFRHLLEKHKLWEALFKAVNTCMSGVARSHGETGIQGAACAGSRLSQQLPTVGCVPHGHPQLVEISPEACADLHPDRDKAGPA
jgi:hypothetical protein